MSVFVKLTLVLQLLEGQAWANLQDSILELKMRFPSTNISQHSPLKKIETPNG